MVANPDITPVLGSTSGWPVTRPELWIAASRRSMSALASYHSLTKLCRACYRKTRFSSTNPEWTFNGE